MDKNPETVTKIKPFINEYKKEGIKFHQKKMIRKKLRRKSFRNKIQQQQQNKKKTMEDHGKKQIKAIEDHGKQLVESNAQVKKDFNVDIDRIPLEEQKKYLMSLLKKGLLNFRIQKK